MSRSDTVRMDPWITLWGDSSQSVLAGLDKWNSVTTAANENHTASGSDNYYDTAGSGQSATNEHTNPNAPISGWTLGNSAATDLNIPSIWFSPELYSSPDQRPSLSGTAMTWQALCSSATDVNNRKLPIEPWDSTQDPLIFGISNLNIDNNDWKKDEKSSSSESHPSVSVGNSTTPVATTAENASLRMESGTVQKETIDTDTHPTAISNEQLCDHLISSNDGWGRRPVDQTTPWNLMAATTTLNDARFSDERHTDISTPTPDTRSTSNAFVPAALRAIPPPPPINTALQSNVWLNEPPTGTGIWEAHYQNIGMDTATGIWNQPIKSFGPLDTMANPVTCNSNVLQNSQMIRSARPWESNDKLWMTDSVNASTGRPVLGSTRGGAMQTNASSSSSFNNRASASTTQTTFDSSTMDGGRCMMGSWDPVTAAAAGNSNSYWNPPTGVAASSSAMNSSTAEDYRRQQSMTDLSSLPNNPHDLMIVHQPLNSNNHYRSDVVQYLTNFGFHREDVQAALIECNMDPDRALIELRKRFNAHTSPIMKSAMPHHNMSGAPFPGSKSSSIAGGPSSLVNKQHSTTVGFSSDPQLPSSGLVDPHPNTQSIRQQLTHQVRSALNMTFPQGSSNSNVGGLMGINGNSLLGQPPPPLLNSGPTMHLASNSGGSMNFMPGSGGGVNRTIQNATPTGRPLYNSSSSSIKRSDRQIPIIMAIQELHKKYQSIQQQIMMYRNNPTMCSQPNSVDVFTELQGQMQQIEAQLKAKQAQLNMAYAQDCAAAAASVPPSSYGGTIPDGCMSNTPTPMINSGSSTVQNPAAAAAASYLQHRLSRGEQMMQQQHHMMDTRFRSGVNGTDNFDGEFPTIGTWNAYPSNANMGGQEKLSPSDNGLPGRASIGFRRTVTRTPQNPPTMWPSGARKLNDTMMNDSIFHPTGSSRPGSCATGQFGGHFRNSDAVKSFNPALKSREMLQQSPSVCDGGQWLLVRPIITNAATGSPNLNNVHTLLSPYGLTHFHTLNPTTGSFLVRVQSPEHAMQLVRSHNDRLLIEPVNEQEQLADLLRINYRPNPMFPTN